MTCTEWPSGIDAVSLFDRSRLDGFSAQESKPTRGICDSYEERQGQIGPYPSTPSPPRAMPKSSQSLFRSTET